MIAVHPVLEGRGQRRIAAGHRSLPPPANSKTPRRAAAAAPAKSSRHDRWRSTTLSVSGSPPEGRSMRADPLPEAPIERIRRHLVALRMPRALETLDHLVQQIERGQLGTLEAIDALLAEELTIRETRRIKAALQMARLTPIRTLVRL